MITVTTISYNISWDYFLSDYVPIIATLIFKSFLPTPTTTTPLPQPSFDAIYIVPVISDPTSWDTTLFRKVSSSLPTLDSHPQFDAAAAPTTLHSTQNFLYVDLQDAARTPTVQCMITTPHTSFTHCLTKVQTSTLTHKTNPDSATSPTLIHKTSTMRELLDTAATKLEQAVLRTANACLNPPKRNPVTTSRRP